MTEDLKKILLKNVLNKIRKKIEKKSNYKPYIIVKVSLTTTAFLKFF